MAVAGQLDGWVENRPSRGLHGPNLRELWAYRELVGFLALRDLKARYKQAAFGVAWALLQPLAGVVVFTLVFHRLAKLPSEGLPYPVFAYVGLTTWSCLSTGVTEATQSLVSHSNLVTKVYLPRLLVPLASVLPGFVDFAISMVMLAALMAVYGVAPTWAVLALPACLVALFVVALGVGLWLSSLNVRYRDVNHAIGLFVQLWLFASPVAYASSLVAEGWRHVYALNPAAGVIEAMRWSLIGGRFPGIDLAVSLGVALLILVGGVLYFQRSERRFSDVI